jgi:hypothetical protein
VLPRTIQASLLRRRLYEEIRQDPEVFMTALGTVILAGIGIGIGLMGSLTAVAEDGRSVGDVQAWLLGVWLAVVTTLVGWLAWTVVNYLLASKLLGGRAEYRQVLRALGLCHGPGVLLALTPVPAIGLGAAVGASIWVLVAALVAVHETQDVDWPGALLSTAPGWLLAFVFLPREVLSAMLAGV